MFYDAEHLGCWQRGQLLSTAERNMYVQVLAWTYVFISLGRGGTAESYGNSKFNFFRTPGCLSNWLHHVTVPPAMNASSSFRILSNTCYPSFHYCHLHGCEICLIVNLICMLRIFLWAYRPFVFIQILCPIWKLVLCIYGWVLRGFCISWIQVPCQLWSLWFEAKLKSTLIQEYWNKVRTAVFAVFNQNI